MEERVLPNFDKRHCHKWAVLLNERKRKIDQACMAARAGDFAAARKLTSEVFHGDSTTGRLADPGMEGSLLYHMAMVTKMAAEPKLILEELGIEAPNIEKNLWKFFSCFISDANELTKEILAERTNLKGIPESLGINDAIHLFEKLTRRTGEVESRLIEAESDSDIELQGLFQAWAKCILDMRLRQEFETIRGFLIIAQLAKEAGIEQLSKAMVAVQGKFGEETVSNALNVALKVGMKREKLQRFMLGDHYIENKMNMEKLEGGIRFLNCPIYGTQKLITDKLNVDDAISSLFCSHFCYAHAKAMLNAVLPFTFELSQSGRMGPDDVCEFSMKLARAPVSVQEKFIPLIVSWNVTLKCNLKCAHCYANAGDKRHIEELSTDAAKMLLHQIAEASRPLLILSGGEPLLRQDIFELIQYGRERGLKMAMGSNGMLINDEVAEKLENAGISTVSISLDSSIPEKHDEFRGVKGSWERAVEAIKALRRNEILTQINATVTKQNYDEIDEIMSLAEKLGVENFHLFFLVPTGRGANLDDVSPSMYEEMIRTVMSKSNGHKLNVKPSCAPQFMRIAEEMGINAKHWIRGCVAGLYYCRIYPTGDVTPCPYLPIKLGNIREKSFKDIWFSSEVLRSLRDFGNLKGKCGTCDYSNVCGGCRARAYGSTSNFTDFCGDLHEPRELTGDYLAEDPSCTYQPKSRTNSKMKGL